MQNMMVAEFFKVHVVHQSVVPKTKRRIGNIWVFGEGCHNALFAARSNFHTKILFFCVFTK